MKLAFLICFSCLLLAFLRIHLRVKTTMIGYEVGKLQSKEIELIQKKSLLNMQLSIMTQKDHLLKITENKTSPSSEDAL